MNISVSTITMPMLAALVALPAYGFKITWTGAADTDAFNEANWIYFSSAAPPAPGAVDPASPIDLFVEVPDSTPTADASAGPFTLGSGGLMQVDGGTFLSTQTIRRDNTPGVDDGSNVGLIISNSFTTSGSVTAQGLVEIDVTLIDVLTLSAGDDPLRFSTVNFADGSASVEPTLNLTNETVSDVLAEHLGKFRVAGVSAVVGSDPGVIQPGDNLLVVSDGATGSVVRPIMDPLPVIASDLSGDGDVDDEDLGLFFSAFTGPDLSQGPLTNPAADVSGDGDVDDEDLGVAFAEFTGPLGPVNVPEPASVVLVAAGAALLRRRR